VFLIEGSIGDVAGGHDFASWSPVLVPVLDKITAGVLNLGSMTHAAILTTDRGSA
tara:strand:+ start:131 stop:295 length:165 start_codon:yes stop_codon:yes gene_type:complete